MMFNGLPREVDLDLGDIIVQVKGGNARRIIRQIQQTQHTTGITTIGYAPDIPNGTWESAAFQGLAIFRSPEELIAYLKEFG